MVNILKNIKLEVPCSLYKKDPESSELGKKIIEHSILLIDEIGFEAFTFKKLGAIINSNESSIYRYFDNKHNLLLYLVSWYWAWIEYQLVFETNNIELDIERLKKAITVVTRPVIEDGDFSHINEVTLSQIIINENAKSFLTKEVDDENKKGLFSPYKRVVKRIADIISDVNNSYKYALSLSSSIIYGSLHQHFIKNHFQSLTNCNDENDPTDYFLDLTIKTLSQSYE